MPIVCLSQELVSLLIFQLPRTPQSFFVLFCFLFSPKNFVLYMFPCSHPHPKSKRACSMFHFISSLIYIFQSDIAHMLAFCSEHTHRRPHSSDIRYSTLFVTKPSVSFIAFLISHYLQAAILTSMKQKSM